jgi:hypothetical protein
MRYKCKLLAYRYHSTILVQTREHTAVVKSFRFCRSFVRHMQNLAYRCLVTPLSSAKRSRCSPSVLKTTTISCTSSIRNAFHHSFKMPISYAILKEQNASTSNAIIEHFESNASFRKLSKFEGDSTIQRDMEDDSKLAKGIAFAQQKGVLDAHHVPQPYTDIDVLGKTPEDVAGMIMNQISGGAAKGEGSVIVLCGLSGTGKVRIEANVVSPESRRFSQADSLTFIHAGHYRLHSRAKVGRIGSKGGVLV